MPELVSAVIPRRRGGWVAAMQSGIKAVDLDGRRVVALASPEADKPGNRFNDAKCDRRGRLFAGTLAIDTKPGEGSLWPVSDPRRTRHGHGSRFPGVERAWLVA